MCKIISLINFKSISILLIILIFIFPTTLASDSNPEVNIINLFEGETYVNLTEIQFNIKHEFDMYITIINFTVEPPNMTCWYKLNSPQEVSIPCQVGDNSYSGLQPQEGQNNLKLFAADEGGNIGTEEVNFIIGLKENKKSCCCKSNSYELGELDEFYQNKDNFKKRKVYQEEYAEAIYLSYKIDLKDKIKAWFHSIL